MSATRQTYSIEEIKDMLLRRVRQVVERYAPAVEGSWLDERKGLWWTLNPGRVDRNVGSFYVHVSGPKAGKWRDHATGDFGDILDLIALRCNCDMKGALSEARAFLGLQTASPEDVARMKDEAERSAQLRREAAKKSRDEAARRSRWAQHLWMSGQPAIRGTPVEFYLRDRRGIDLAAIGRQPRAIRFHPSVRFDQVDEETGEVFEGAAPAMLSAVVDIEGRFTAVHRTWLGLSPVDGRWDKAAIPKPKMVVGDYGGAAINVWRGVGPRGGKPASLPKCPPGSRVYITEGVEDALSVVQLLPDERVLAAISLSNFGAVRLPENVATVTLVGDRDQKPEAQEALERAVAQHREAGRQVKLWLNAWGGKDINDALRAARGRDSGKGAA